MVAPIPTSQKGTWWYDVVYTDTIDDEKKTDDNKLSSGDSKYDIYGWYDSANKIY